MKKKLLAVIFAVALFASTLAGCTSGSSSNGKTYKIGALQFVQHPALDSAYKGFVDQLKVNGFEEGKNLTIDFQNAQGDTGNCSTIANKFKNENLDMTLGIATPAAQALANAITDKPVIFTAITDPVDAKLVNAIDKPGTNCTGTSDMSSIADQLKMLMQVCPNVKNVGILYTSSEPNSVIQGNLATQEGTKLGLNMITYTITSSNEITQVVTSMVGKVDAIYAPTDNVLASAMPTVTLVTEPNKIPVYAAEAGMVKSGATMTLGIDYYKLGQQTGDMAAKILKGEAEAKTMPVEYQTEFSYTVNVKNAAAIGITFPQDILDKAEKVNQ
ncbi:MAG: ABC transporter substrate-binding protein [Oscillospiraceae bacterium]|nr:ABC transporter substrate-binding protein [Oscillospiraceae bacterium]